MESESALVCTLTDMPADITCTIMNFLPDIRVLQITREFDRLVREHADYPRWCKCAAAGSVYSHGTVKMLGDQADLWKMGVAAKYGNIELVVHLFSDKTASYETISAAIENAASAAVLYDQVSVVEYLHSNCKKISEYLIIDTDIIMARAAENGSLRVMKFALNVGASVNHHLLDSTLLRGQFDAFKLMVSHAGVESARPVMYRIIRNLELVKHLLRDNVGSTMSTAAVHDQVDIVKYLLGVRKKIFDHPQADSDIIMANAVSYGSLRVIEFMADSGATISSRLLENAITRRQFDAFKLLVNRGGIALIYPIVGQITDLDLIKFVVGAGVHVSYLMENTRRSSRDVLEFLISQGAEEPEYLG